MNVEQHAKVTASQLARKAFLYVRQSTLRQVAEHGESTKRQYDLRQRAIALGWPVDSVVVIDSDLGQSGASTDRAGFALLVSEVGMGHAGIVLGLEVSRLARNSTDWHRLLEICALTDTLILDEEGIYDPSHFNDRLLLGLKGTMSEAELHVMRARLRGGLLNKARRGELQCLLPIGFVYDDQGRVVLDPDRQVQNCIRLLFATYARTGAAHTTAKYFHGERILFPRHVHGGERHGELIWGPLSINGVVSILHNPRYAGAFVYGRRRSRRQPDGKKRLLAVPRDQWLALVLDAHPAYISWDQFESNQQRLRDTGRAFGSENRQSPPREGPALVQGLLLCGVCGLRMTVRYRRHKSSLTPIYFCQRRGMAHAEPLCTSMPGTSVDSAVSDLVVESLTPAAIGVSLQVEREIQARVEEADQLRRQQVERARHGADVARRRFMRVDPDNRLVADSLEAEWNQALRVLSDAQQNYERERSADLVTRDAAQHARLLGLARDFGSVWRDASTPARERKRMVRLLVEDITLKRGEVVTLHVRFRGGATTTLTLPPPLSAWQLRQTDASVRAEMDALLSDHTIGEVATILNERGRMTGAGAPFTPVSIWWQLRVTGIKDLKQRLLDAGMLTGAEVARRLGVTASTVRSLRQAGRLRARACNDKGEWLYDPTAIPTPTRGSTATGVV